jgi:hypothetical protein
MLNEIGWREYPKTKMWKATSSTLRHDFNVLCRSNMDVDITGKLPHLATLAS